MTRREFWDHYVRVYDGLNCLREYRVYLRAVIERFCVSPGELILDAGSGTGNLSIEMRKVGARVISLDFSPVALAIHKEKDPAASVVQASLGLPLPFGSGTFDGVVCTSVLSALPTTGVRTALREFRRVLKPRGRLVVTAGKKGLSKLRFARDCLFARLRVHSVFGFLREVRRTLGPLLRIMYYNFLMCRLRRHDGYRQFTRGELIAEVADAGFVQLEHRSTYGGLLNMVQAVSPQQSGFPGGKCLSEASESSICKIGKAAQDSGRKGTAQWPPGACLSTSPVTRMRPSI